MDCFKSGREEVVELDIDAAALDGLPGSPLLVWSPKKSKPSKESPVLGAREVEEVN